MSSKYKYHRGKEQKGRCCGARCLHCHMLGRTTDLYGEPLQQEVK